MQRQNNTNESAESNSIGNLGSNNEVDELFEVKTYFYIGAYQQCLNEINKIKITGLKKDCYMWRAYIAQRKYRVVLDGISSSNTQPICLPAIRKVAEYFTVSSSLEKRNAIIKYFDDDLTNILNQTDSDEQDADKIYANIVWRLSAATVYYNEALYENALHVLYTAASIWNDLECLAMQLQCFLKINRLDLARKSLSKMQDKDDDATLTQLATAWINIEQGGEKLQDAYYILQDFCDKFVPTSLLLNAQAVCFIAQEKYEEADGGLTSSLDKDPNNLDTLINMLVLTQHQNTTGKLNEDIGRYLSQIKDLHSNCQLVAELERKDHEFDRLALKYEPSVKR